RRLGHRVDGGDQDARHPRRHAPHQARRARGDHDAARRRLPAGRHVRRRLSLAIAGVAALAVILFAIPLALALERTYRDDELLRLQRDAFAATRAIDLGRPGSDPVELPPTPRAIAVYDATGRRVAGRGGPARADALTLAAI